MYTSDLLASGRNEGKNHMLYRYYVAHANKKMCFTTQLK
jgi:hypothetical protein